MQQFDIWELEKNGTLQFLYDHGHITPGVINYLNYFRKYKWFRDHYGWEIVEAIRQAAFDYGVSERTIRRAVKRFE